MSFVASAECKLPVSAEVAFDRLADSASWKRWMPATFRPTGAMSGALREGDKLRVRLVHSPVPTPIAVRVVRRAKELTWTAGVPGVLWGEHSFFFEEEEGGVRVRSVETYSGAMSPLVRRFVLPIAQRVAGEMLAGLAKAVS